MNLSALIAHGMRISAFGLLFALPCHAATILALNRQSVENTVSVETTVFGPIQIQLRHGKTDALLFDGILEGPGIFAIDNLPASGINNLALHVVPGKPSNARDFTYQIPFSANADWRISQGFQGDASHNDAMNEFAVDFDISLGTPVLAARAGVVMEVIDSFPDNGKPRKSNLDQANLIRILHEDGSMAVYGHLLQDSALVEPGQWLIGGASIAQSGNSGYTHGPHLHFVIQVNTGMQLASIPFQMKSVNGLVDLSP